jgi:8-oxo-dGTP diphosphatase
MLTVVAALIESEGKLLVCQRRRGDSFALQWEFPGGKLQPGETAAQALARELEEELGAKAEIGAEVFRTRHRYSELAGEIELFFLQARVDPAAVRNLAFEQMLWAERAALPALNFLPADRELIAKLVSGALQLSS